MDAGDFAAACPKLAESQRLDPAPGTLLNLAECYERQGRTATAWATWKQAAAASAAAGQQDREQLARDRAAALEPKLSRLRIVVPEPHAVPDLAVVRDSEQLTSATWGVAVPVDPGTHQIEVHAPGYQSWSQTVEVSNDADRVVVEVPMLAPAGAPAAAPPAGSPAPGTAPASSPPPAGNWQAPPAPEEQPERGGLGTQRSAALALGIVGVVGVAAGSGLGLAAADKNDESEQSCFENLCNQEGVDARDEAFTLAHASTAAFVVGGVAGAVGITLWLTAPRRDSASLRLQVAGHGVRLEGNLP
jgi:serine/threonine-protein kinase